MSITRVCSVTQYVKVTGRTASSTAWDDIASIDHQKSAEVSLKVSVLLLSFSVRLLRQSDQYHDTHEEVHRAHTPLLSSG